MWETIRTVNVASCTTASHHQDARAVSRATLPLLVSCFLQLTGTGTEWRNYTLLRDARPVLEVIYIYPRLIVRKCYRCNDRASKMGLPSHSTKRKPVLLGYTLLWHGGNFDVYEKRREVTVIRVFRDGSSGRVIW